MKKFILAAMMLAVTFGASAQITFGVKAGANFSSVSNYAAGTIVDWGTLVKSETNPSMKVGFNAGVFAEYKLSSLLGVQVEALYSLQGVNTKNTTTSILGNGEAIENLSTAYINVPVLAKAHFGKLAVYAGPQFGFVASMATKYITGSDDSKKEQTDKIKAENYNAFDLSVAVGASYMLTRNIGIDARYNLGVTNVFAAKKDSDGKVTKEAYGKNGSIQAGVFYAF